MIKEISDKEFIEISKRLVEISIEIEECLAYPNIGVSCKGSQLYDLLQEGKKLMKKTPLKDGTENYEWI